MAQKAREEVLQRQRAIMNHRHFFLSEDDASQTLDDGAGVLQQLHTGRGGAGAGTSRDGQAHSPELEYEVEEGEVLPPDAAARLKALDPDKPQKGEHADDGSGQPVVMPAAMQVR